MEVVTGEDISEEVTNIDDEVTVPGIVRSSRNDQLSYLYLVCPAVPVLLSDPAIRTVFTTRQDFLAW